MVWEPLLTTALRGKLIVGHIIGLCGAFIGFIYVFVCSRRICLGLDSLGNLGLNEGWGMIWLDWEWDLKGVGLCN